MSGSYYRILYVVERALESTADDGLRPARVYWAAFPLYIAEVSATVLAREPFDLLDRYVSLAMAECRFRSVSEIAEGRPAQTFLRRSGLRAAAVEILRAWPTGAVP
jgi:hypothetical protein